MKHAASTFLLTAVALFISHSAKAQLTYKEREYITIGTEIPDPNYGITANGFGLMRLSGTRGFLGVSTGHTYCYIMGSDMAVCFYDAYLNKYNNIRALYVLRRANGEIYDDWIEPQSNATSVIRSLRPVSYRLREPDNSLSEQAGLNIGLISQEVQQVTPKAVVTDPHGNQLVNYTALTPVAVHAITQLYERAEQNRQRLQQILGLLEK